MSQPLTFTYTNWRGETAERRVIPETFRFAATEWHPEPQWLLVAFDVDKAERRDFAVKDIALPIAASKLECEPVTAERIREIIEEEANGAAACGWHPCSGCYETEDGHPVGKYPFSRLLGTAVGDGCHECGGLGARWITTRPRTWLGWGRSSTTIAIRPRSTRRQWMPSPRA